jgi:hypothetical protein
VHLTPPSEPGSLSCALSELAAAAEIEISNADCRARRRYRSRAESTDAVLRESFILSFYDAA